MYKIDFIEAKQLKQKPAPGAPLPFGKTFTDYMFTMEYNPQEGWHAPTVRPYADLSLDPAAMVLHYGQTIFEGLKAYPTKDGRYLLFRPRDNFNRMNNSARRLCIPEINIDMVMDGLLTLLRVEKDWIPREEGTSLYIRPTIIATDPYVGVKVSSTYLFYIIIGPVGPYYAEGFNPVKIYIEDEYVRAVRGGLGFAKTAANYAASLLAGEVAASKGYTQVLWLDGVERKYVEEVGSMNMLFKFNDELATPALNGSILPGITRDSVLKLAAKMGIKTAERKISIDEVYDRYKAGELEEAFGSGTAAVISPVGEFNWAGRIITLNDMKTGPLAKALYDELTGIQFGEREDTFGWTLEF